MTNMNLDNAPKPEIKGFPVVIAGLSSPIPPPADETPYTALNDARVYEGPLNPTVMERTVSVAFGAGARQGDKWRNVTGPFGALLNQLTVHAEGKKDGVSLLQGEASGGARISKAMTTMDIIGIDIDNGISFDDLCDAVVREEYFALVYSTHSYGATTTGIPKEKLLSWIKARGGERRAPTLSDARDYLLSEKSYVRDILEHATLLPEAANGEKGWSIWVQHEPIEKTRVILPLADTFHVNTRGLSPDEGRVEWAERYRGLCKRLSIPHDPACEDLARLFYMPRHRRDAAPGDVRMVVLNGAPVDLESIERVPAPSKGRAADLFATAALEMGASRVRIESDIDRVVIAHGKGLCFAEVYAEYSERSRSGSGDKTEGLCPFDDDHSNAGDADDHAFYCTDGDGETGFMAGCMHATCIGNHGRDRLSFVRKFCADHDITGEMLRDYVALQDGELFVLDRQGEASVAPFADYPSAETEAQDAKDPVAASAFIARLGTSVASGVVKAGQANSLLTGIAKRTGATKSALQRELSSAEKAAQAHSRAQV